MQSGEPCAKTNKICVQGQDNRMATCIAGTLTVSNVISHAFTICLRVQRSLGQEDRMFHRCHAESTAKAEVKGALEESQIASLHSYERAPFLQLGLLLA